MRKAVVGDMTGYRDSGLVQQFIGQCLSISDMAVLISINFKPISPVYQEYT